MMKFGLRTAILDGWTFEEVVDIASEMGFKCLEVACWPAGKAERRYAGVSHYVWQGLDYLKTIYDFSDRIFHIHFKDIKLYPERLAECGVLAYPLDYMSPKIPGLGDVNWGAFVSALNDIRFNGCAVIEAEQIRPSAL